MAQTDIAANDAMAAADGHSSSAKREAREFLQETLREGPVLQQQVIADAKANGISQRTLRRAKEDLKVESYKARTANAGWMWELPKMRTPPERENDGHVGHLRLCQGFNILALLAFFEGGQGGQHSHWGEGGHLRICRCGGTRE
jgi:hypothetical protein